MTPSTCRLTVLVALLCPSSLDDSASNLPFGSSLSLQALNKIHNAISANLLSSVPVASLSDLFSLCQHLVSSCSITLPANDFTPPSLLSSLSAATETFGGILLEKFRSIGLYKYTIFTVLTGLLTSPASRDPTINENLNTVLGDMTTSASSSGGGILPSEVCHLPFKHKFLRAFEHFLDFKHLEKCATPFTLEAYFRLREKDVGIRIENPAVLDANVPNLLRLPSSGLAHVTVGFCCNHSSQLPAYFASAELKAGSLLRRPECRCWPQLY